MIPPLAILDAPEAGTSVVDCVLAVAIESSSISERVLVGSVVIVASIGEVSSEPPFPVAAAVLEACSV